MARAPPPSAAASHTWNVPLPLSADRASVLPSGDHPGCRLSPGRSVTCRACEPSGCTVQVLILLPPFLEKNAIRSRDDQVGPKLQYFGSDTRVTRPPASSSTYTAFSPLRSELKQRRVPAALGATRP